MTSEKKKTKMMNTIAKLRVTSIMQMTSEMKMNSRIKTTLKR